MDELGLGQGENSKERKQDNFDHVHGTYGYFSPLWKREGCIYYCIIDQCISMNIDCPSLTIVREKHIGNTEPSLQAGN